MKKADVEIGKIYIVKVSGVEKPVRIKCEVFPKGWIGVSILTGREVRIRSAAKLRREVIK